MNVKLAVLVLLGFVFDPSEARGEIRATGACSPAVAYGFVWRPEAYRLTETTGLVSLESCDYQMTFGRTSTELTWTYHVQYDLDGGAVDGTLSVSFDGPFNVSTGQVVDNLVGKGYTVFTGAWIWDPEQNMALGCFSSVQVLDIPEPQSLITLFAGLGVVALILGRRK